MREEAENNYKLKVALLENEERTAALKVEFQTKLLDEKVRESEAKAISIEEISVIEQARSKSEKLGNLRTGTMAASAVANIAGTAIAATNTASPWRLPVCACSTTDLSHIKQENFDEDYGRWWRRQRARHHQKTKRE